MSIFLFISMLRIFCASPKSSISNSFLCWVFSFSISSWLLETINISSTYRRSYIRDPLSSLRKYTQVIVFASFVLLLQYKLVKSFVILSWWLFQSIQWFFRFAHPILFSSNSRSFGWSCRFPLPTLHVKM